MIYKNENDFLNDTVFTIEPKPTTHDTSKYRLTSGDIERIVAHTLELLKEKSTREDI